MLVKALWSSFASTLIIIDGVDFKSAEHIFQMMKFKDAKYVLRVWNGKTASNKDSRNIRMTAKSYETILKRTLGDWFRNWSPFFAFFVHLIDNNSPYKGYLITK